MDSLSTELQETIRKMRRGRLISQLVKAGVEKETVEEMDRQQLMQEWARLVSQGHESQSEETVQTTLSSSSFVIDPNLKRERFEFERLKYQEEREERRRREEKEEEENRLEHEERRRREEKEEKEKRLEQEERRRREEKEEEEKRLEREERRKKEEKEEEERRKKAEKEEEEKRLEHEERRREFKLREDQLDLKRQRLKQSEATREAQDEERGIRRSLAGRIKFFNDALKGMIGRFPSDHPADITSYFEHIERLFDQVKVDEDVKSNLLIGNLSERTKALTSRLSPEQFRDYTALKKFLLKEFHISPVQLRERFLTTRKSADETYASLASRLKNTITYYVQSRSINKDYESLNDLLCADRMKELLSKECLNFTLARERGEWMRVDQLAGSVDTFMASHHSIGEPVKHGGPFPPRENRLPKAVSQGESNNSKKSESPIGSSKVKAPSKEEVMRRGLCFTCLSPGHRANLCPKNKGPEAEKKFTKVNACGVKALNDSSAFQEKVSGTYPLVVEADQFYVRKYVGVDIEAVGVQQALEDGGAETCCLRESLVQHLQLPVRRQLRLTGLKGQDELVGVVCLHVRPALSESEGLTNIAPAIRVWFAVVPNLSEAVILTPAAVSLLKDTESYSVLAVSQSEAAKASDQQQHSTVVAHPTDVSREECEAEDNQERGESLVEDFQSGQEANTSISSDEVSNGAGEQQTVFLDIDAPETFSKDHEADTSTLAREQRGCDTLKPYFEQTTKNNSKFFLDNNLLYHRDKILGHNINQLCLPESRIDKVLEMGHDAAFAGHMEYKTTRDRIRLSFWFPRMEDRIKSYCDSCLTCQLRAPVMVAHRVPIQPISRNGELPFSHVAADCIGPLLPEGDPFLPKPEYNFAIVMVDRFSRWPIAYPLRSLSAKAVCEAFLNMFMTHSVPRVISSDCGTNFTSKLTQEFLKRLGCSPRFSTPRHPESCGLVERCNQTLKVMIYKLAQTNPRGWHRLLPFVLWGLRERPSATTHVSPYMLIYGSTPRGPLSILKESWVGDRQLPFSIGKTPEEYMQGLKTNLELAQSYTQLILTY